jgi:hypothetical protein
MAQEKGITHMKNAPLTGVRISESCSGRQREEITTPSVSIKSESSQEDRPERFSPYESPHSFHTEEDRAAFIFSHQPEDIGRKMKTKTTFGKEPK